MLRRCLTVASLFVSGCLDATAPTPVAATLRVELPEFQNVEWPQHSTAMGGSRIVIRGRSSLSCADPVVEAIRNGRDVTVELDIKLKAVPCFAMITNDRWEIELHDLEPGRYFITTRASGRSQQVRAVVELTD